MGHGRVNRSAQDRTWLGQVIRLKVIAKQPAPALPGEVIAQAGVERLYKMTLKASETIGAKELQRVSCNSTIGEIWLAYLHLVNAKHRVKSPELYCVLDAASCAALKALREAQVLKSQLQPTA